MNKVWGLLSNFIFMIKFMYKTNPKMVIHQCINIISNIITPFLPIIFIRMILNEVTYGKDIKLSIIYVFCYATATFGIELFNIFNNYFLSNQTNITVYKIKHELGKAAMKMKYSDVETTRIRDFMELAKDGAQYTQLIDCIVSIISAIVTAAGLFAIILTLQPIIFVFVLLTVCTRLFAERENRKLWEKWRPIYAPIMRKNGYLIRIMRDPEFGKEVRINELQDWIYDKTEKSVNEYLRKATKHNAEIQKNGLFSVFSNIFQEGVVYFILAYKMFFNGLKIGDFSMYMTSVNTFSNNVSSIVTGVSSIMQTGLFVKEFRYCIEKTKDDYIDNTEDIKIPVADAVGNLVSIEFKNVSFAYPYTDSYILKNVSFEIRGNKSVSIVGINGAGKTTLIKLLCRFYEPTEGTILINGIDISTIPYNIYSDYISAVFQDFRTLHFSIEENILFNSDNTTINIVEAVNCIQRAGLADVVNKLPNGMKTNISKEFDAEGVELSGGETQKLMIARALYKNAPIMILDEPTSALDPLTEADIYSKFNSLTKNKLTIYISHRLSSCQFCDNIIVLNNGEIEQQGTHTELLESSGLYSQMWNMQSQYYVG